MKGPGDRGEAFHLTRQRDEPGLTWPVVEYDHRDPLFQRAAITGLIIYRQTAITQLQHLMIFGDNPSGQIFYVDADLRFGEGPQGQIFVLNKRDGVIRLLVPDAPAR